MLLRPVLANGAQVVTLSSGTIGDRCAPAAYRRQWTPLADLLRPGRTNGLAAYSTSKLAAVYLAYEGAVRWPDLQVNAYDPGLVASTGLARHLPGPAQAALRRSEGLLARVAPFAHAYRPPASRWRSPPSTSCGCSRAGSSSGGHRGPPRSSPPAGRTTGPSPPVSYSPPPGNTPLARSRTTSRQRRASRAQSA